MQFLVKGLFGDFEQKNLAAAIAEFTPMTQHFSRLNKNLKLLNMRICDKQRYSFNRRAG